MSKWKRVGIVDVCESIIDCINKTAPKIDEPSPFKMLRTTNIRYGRVSLESVKYVTEETYHQWTRRQVPKRGDVLLTREAPMGEAGMLLTDEHVFLGQRIVSYRTNPQRLDNYFLLYALQSDDLQSQIRARASGSTVQHMRVPDTKALQIPLPCLPEQKKIVAILDEVFEGIDVAIANTEKNLTNTRELFESYLNTIFTRTDNAWEWGTLSDITTDITDGDHQPPPKSQSGIPFITISNIDKRNRSIDFSDTFMVPPEYYRNLKEKRKPRKGDLLYTVTGSYAIPVIVDHDAEFCLQRHIGLIRPDNSIKPKCLYFLSTGQKLESVDRDRVPWR